MSNPLDALLDERAVAHTLARYADALDMRQWSLLDDVFAEDCVARFGADEPRVGKAAIVAAIRAYLDQCGPTQHLIGNLVVSAGDAGIESRCYVRGAHQAATSDATFWSLGSYMAEWRREAKGLRIITWTMAVAFNSGDPAVFGANPNG